MKNALYFGDCLEVMREFSTESVDLIYLDPPFNSKADYNVLFNSPTGDKSISQIGAFEDTWHWCQQSEQEFSSILKQSNTNVSELIDALRRFLGENDMMAYLVMMASRLLEMHRVLKSTGSIYLHCDPTASHYLKIVLDAVFGKLNMKNEIIWRRTGAHNKCDRWGPIHDVILFFTKSDKYIWNNPKQPYMSGHVEEHFEKDNTGYKTAYYGNVLTGSGVRNGESGMEWRGINPTAKGRHWAIPGKLWEDSGIDGQGLTQHQKLDKLLAAGLIKFIDGQFWPIYERYIRSDDGPAIGDIWAYQPYTGGTVHESELGIDADVSWIKTVATERLGYPTQKPVGLLERIIKSSSNEGDIVLDPFCGCGTAVYAAQKLNRRWMGIDITHLAISLIEKRLRDAFPSITFDTFGTPKDIDGARDLALRDKYQFQWWACSLVGAQPYQGKKKGADGGIDGIIYFQDDIKSQPKKIIVSVKGGQHTSVTMIRDLAAVIEREKAEIGLFVTLEEPTKPMKTEAVSKGFYICPHNNIQYPRIQILTVSGLLDGTERAAYTDLQSGNLTLKKAELVKTEVHQHTLI